MSGKLPRVLRLLAEVRHLSFASLAPGYLGTSRDRTQTRSWEADKSPTSIRQLLRGAGHLWYWVTDKDPAFIPLENPSEVPAQIPGPNDDREPPPQPRTCFPAGRDVSMHKSPTLSRRVPRYCLGTRGQWIQMMGALGTWAFGWKLADTKTRLDYIATATNINSWWNSNSNINVYINCRCHLIAQRLIVGGMGLGVRPKFGWSHHSVLCLLNTPVMRLIRWNVCCWSDIHTFVQMCLFYVELVANPTKLWNTDAKLQEHCLNNQFYQKICLHPRFCDQPLVLQIHVLTV